MRAFSVEEIDILVEGLMTLVGSCLQEVAVSQVGCGLGLYVHKTSFRSIRATQSKESDQLKNSKEMVWLWFEGHSWWPMFLPLTTLPEPARRPPMPLQLFLRAHFVGCQLNKVERVQERGRAVRLYFTPSKPPYEEPFLLEIDLWPHGGNVKAMALHRQMLWRKPIQTASPPTMTVSPPFQDSLPPRSLEEIVLQWRNTRLGGATPTAASQNSQSEAEVAQQKWRKEMQKLEKAIMKVKDELAKKKSAPWREVGHWLLLHQSIENAPAEIHPFIDGRRSFSWNIQNVFHKAKETERKTQVTEQRLLHLEKEWTQLKNVVDVLSWMKSSNFHQGQVKKTKSNRQPKLAQYRTVKLDHGLLAQIGKSATDNLALLRVAKPWHLWLHLRDFPGAHGFISKEKAQKVSDQELRRVGCSLVEQTFGPKAKQQVGEKFEVLVAECRFVRPLRGDKHGRVTYTNEKVLPFQYVAETTQ